MLSRRLFATLPVVVPFAGNLLPRLDLQDTRHEPLDVGATTILSISPDGAVLAGVQFRNRLCFLDAVTLDVLARGDQTDVLQMIDRASVHWSPDQTRIAFSLNAWRQMRDSDIYIADVATATITNLTAEGGDEESASIIDEPDVAVDVYPRWIDDATILFARHEDIGGGDSTCALSTLRVTTGAVEPFVPLDPHGYRFVSSPPLLRADGSLVMTVQGGAQPSEIVIVDAAGELTPVEIDGVQAPELQGATNTQLLVWDVAGYALLVVPIDNPAAAIPFADIFDYGDGYQFIGRPAVASAPEAYSGVAVSASSGKHRVFTMIDGERRDRGHLGGEVGNPTCHLASGVLLIAEERNAWLIDISG